MALRRLTRIRPRKFATSPEAPAAPLLSRVHTSVPLPAQVNGSALSSSTTHDTVRSSLVAPSSPWGGQPSISTASNSNSSGKPADTSSHNSHEVSRNAAGKDGREGTATNSKSTVHSSVHSSGASHQGRKSIEPFDGPPPFFDTHKVVQILMDNGFTYSQAEAILVVMRSAADQAATTHATLLATKEEHVQLKAELNEKVFNSTLRFDIAQRHMRELIEKDFNNLKSDLRMLETKDFNDVREEIAALEKRVLLSRQSEDDYLRSIQLDIERVEKRVLQYGVGFAGTLLAVGLGIARLVA